MKKNPYIENGKKLRALGLISSDYKFNTKLSPAQKGVITKKTKEFKDLLLHPDRYHTPHVGKNTIKAAKYSPYTITKTNRIIIPKNGAKSVTVKNGFVQFFEENSNYKRKIGQPPEKFESDLRKLLAVKLSHNQMVTIQIGDSPPFSRSRFGSIEELFFYMNNEFEPKDARLAGTRHEKIKQLMPYMSVVTINKDEEDEE